MKKRSMVNAIIYTLLFLSLTYLILQDKVTLFLHPRMVKYVYLLWLGVIVMGGYEWTMVIKRLKAPSGKLFIFRKGHVSFLVFFILLGTNPTQMTLDITENKASSYLIKTPPKTVSIVNPNTDNSDTITLEVKEETPIDQDTNDKNTASDTEVPSSSDTEVSSSSDLTSGLENPSVAVPNIETGVNTDDFLEQIDAIGMDQAAYIGKTVTLEGFVYREAFFDDNALVVGRLLISCCAADSSVAGLYLESDSASQFENEAWIRVTGKIAVKELYFPDMDASYETVYIENAQIESIPPHESPYVYQTFN